LAPWLLLAASVVGLGGCGKEQAAAPAMPTVPVVAAQAERKTVPVEIRAIGNVEAYSNVSIKAQVTGLVTAVHFHEGQDVHRGDVLFEIDKRPFEVALQQAEADYARDTAKAQNTRMQAGRYAKLYEQGVAAREQYDSILADANSQEASVRSDQAAIDNAKLNLEYCTIKSPIDGRTGSVLVYPGNLTKANDVPILVVINQLVPIYVNFAVPEQYLADVKRYMAAGSLRVMGQIPDQPGASEQGALTFIDNSVDNTTGTIHMKATFPNTQRKLWPGQFVTIVLTLTSEPNVIVVPSSAINVSQNGQFVYVVNSDNTAESRTVVTGRTIGGETVITSGLQPGETVVTDGQLRLVSGARVSLKAGNPQK
jgi:multidrug efflux system membrane fusion protein